MHRFNILSLILLLGGAYFTPFAFAGEYWDIGVAHFDTSDYSDWSGQNSNNVPTSNYKISKPDSEFSGGLPRLPFGESIAENVKLIRNVASKDKWLAFDLFRSAFGGINLLGSDLAPIIHEAG